MSQGDANPRRVLLLITTSDFGGTESFLERLALRLDRRRFEPVVCSLCPPGRVGRRLADAGVRVESLGMSAGARPRELLGGAVRLRRRIDELGIDVVQGLLYRANVLGAVAARTSRRRPVMVAGQRSMTPMTGRASIWASRLTRRFCHRIVAVSDAVAEELVRAEGARREGIVVIGNGVDAELFRPGDRAEARRRLGLDPGALTVGAVGRLAVEKGYHHLLDALATVRRAGHPLELALIGGGGEADRLADQARRLDVAGAVHFLGVRQELHELYPAFDLFALPSLEEGSPMALLEAMACALPSVATRVGGVPEAVEDGRSGLLVSAADPEALAAALTRLATDPDLRHQLGRAARRRVEEGLSLERVVRSYEELWEGLAAGLR